MFKIVFKTIRFSFLFLVLSSLNIEASDKKINCPAPNNDIGLEAFYFVTSGINHGFEKKCNKDFKYFNTDEIDISDSGKYSVISPKEIEVVLKKISPSRVVFYEIRYKDESNKNQTMIITVTTKEGEEGEQGFDSPCASVLSVTPNNLIRKSCI